jgi:hypothetical protein
MRPEASYTDQSTAADSVIWGRILRVEGITWSVQRIPTAVNIGFLDRRWLLFHSSTSSVILTRLRGPRSRTTATQENLTEPGI